MSKRKARLVYLLSSGISFVLSVSLWFLDYRDEAVFVGIWVPSILALGSLMLQTSGEKR
jgi:hypothetical protein